MKFLVVILSLLPLKDAAATSVLSSRWSELWKHTPNLNFSYSTISYRMRHTEIKGSSWDVERSKYVQLVDSVLQSHKAISLKEFGISFYVNKSAHIKLANWLQIVFLRGVERLKLDVNLNGFYSDPEYEVVLEELLRGSGLCRPQTLILFKSLKRLCPKWLKVSGEDIKLFLGNCPLLEELIIGEGNWTSDVEVCGASLKLKDLEAYGCYAKKSIKFLLQILLGLRSTMHQRRCYLRMFPNLLGRILDFDVKV